ncbi:hypothetical protein IWX84_001735 [Flavobacterium sp. CG_9.10]|uniref:T9SS sorting signal type C domain-containing protein n=1 Tax=Flavobacterium sp. CG_9.10 TaxID=2787729 RepID=UPI0018CA0624|nr:T9SS sorting signal type C domain-containing protein [Flavobacterium sp. CG_9.10]MBG6110853.1 hypothetical protein [Flavobacterium sp. CG_9.10]
MIKKLLTPFFLILFQFGISAQKAIYKESSKSNSSTLLNSYLKLVQSFSVRKLNEFKVIFVLIALFSFSLTNAATIISAGSGSWSTPSTWVGGVVPLASDNVTIGAGHAVTVTVSASITNLNLSTTTSKLIINSSQTFTVIGTFANSGTTTNGVNGPGTILFTGTTSFGILTLTGVPPSIIIGNGFSTNTITVGANTIVTDVTVNVGATLSTMNRVISVNGNFINNGKVSGTTAQVNLSTGNFSNTGTFTLSTGQVAVSTGNFNSTSSFIFTNAGFLKLGGNFTYSGIFTLFIAQVQFTGSANQSIQGFTTTGLVSMLKIGGTATLTGNVSAGGLTISGAGGTLDLVSGTHTFNGTWTRTNGTLNCGSSLLRIGASIAGTGVGTFSPGTGTVEYYGAAQTAAVVNYNNLIISGTKNKTFSTPPTVNGTLYMAGTTAAVIVTTGAVTYGANATLQYNKAAAYAATSEEWITPFASTGGVVIANTGIITLNEAKVFNPTAPLTIGLNAKLNTSGSNWGLTFGGNFINNGGILTANASPITITDVLATQSIGAFNTAGTVSMTKTAGIATLTGNVTGGLLTINGSVGTLNLGIGLTHTFSGLVTLIAGTLNAGSSTINANLVANPAWTNTAGVFVPGTGTVNFGGAGAQFLTGTLVTSFNNLTVSASGLKSLTKVPLVNGTLSMEGTATVSAAPTYGPAAKLQYNTTTPRLSSFEWITPFTATGGVRVISTGTITANSAKIFNASVPLTVGNGTNGSLDNGGFLLSGVGTFSLANGGTLNLSGTSTFPSGFATNALGATSTVKYSGTGQTVAIQNYGNLALSGIGNKTFAGATVISGNLSLGTGTVSILSGGSVSTSTALTFIAVSQPLGSYGGALSSASNKNVTYFGNTTTGVLNVGVICVPGTWTGLISSDWNVANNWCGLSIPNATTDVIIPAAPTRKPIITLADALCQTITIDNGASLSFLANFTLAVSGNWINNGIFTAGIGTVNFTGTADQSIGGLSTNTFNNLSNSNVLSTLYTTKDIIVNGILNNSSATSVFDLSTFALTGGAAFTNSGSGQIISSNLSTNPIPSGKIWTNTINYASSTRGQTIVGGIYNAIPSLQLNNISGTQTASGHITVGNQLNIDNGGAPIFNMNGFNLAAGILNMTPTNAVLDMQSGNLLYDNSVLSASTMNGTVRFSGATNGLYVPTGTVDYYGAAQTVAGGDYNNLLFSGLGGSYSIANDINVTKLTVTNGAVTVKDGVVTTADDVITVTVPGSLTFENSASLVQTTYTGANTGNITYKRLTNTAILNSDSVFWSSPVTVSGFSGPKLSDVSPNTNLFYSFDTTENWKQESPTKLMDIGVGYSILGPKSNSAPSLFQASFIGTPNNGSYPIAITGVPPLPVTDPNAGKLYLLGNPYPSAIDADLFLAANTILDGTLYFWTHSPAIANNIYTDADYASYNTTGSVGIGPIGAVPSGIIAAGQGFFATAIDNGTVRFTNDMRVFGTGPDGTLNNSQFFKLNNTKAKTSIDMEKNRIWLDFFNEQGAFKQALIGYISDATNNYDNNFDGESFDGNKYVDFYSINQDKNLVIQGRALPFDETDAVPLGYRTIIDGDFTIRISQADGFLYDQAVFIEDKLNNTLFDLKSGDYTFSTVAGTFNDRFVLRYTNKTLGTNNFDKLDNQIVISKDKNELKIKSELETIKRITVFDILGRKIFEKDVINSNEFHTSSIALNNQTVVVKVTLNNGKVISKKVIY